MIAHVCCSSVPAKIVQNPFLARLISVLLPGEFLLKSVPLKLVIGDPPFGSITI